MRRLALVLVLVLVTVVAVPLLGAHVFGWDQHPDRVPAPARRVEIGGGRALNVLDEGEGPPIVLVHGLPGNLQEWGDVPEKLAAMGHRVIAYDRVGYGSSTRDAGAPGEYTYASNARDLLALLDTLGIERAALAGWSYGGGVVQTFAAEHPGRVSQVALIGAVGPAFAPSESDVLDLVIASGAGEEILRWVGTVPPVSRAFLHENLVPAFSKASAIPDGYAERTQAMLALPGTLTAFIVEGQRSEPAALRPEQIRVPALVLHGADDRLVPVSVGEDLAKRLPEAELLRLPGGSHMLPLTHPDLVAGALHALVAQHGAASPEGGAQAADEGSRREP
ncbi:MAG: alpha/beta hydrolase [Deltaproteobacteria bacterium]|nr:alpha/beta hydrolase [Deltaproteobacteria bacterium]